MTSSNRLGSGLEEGAELPEEWELGWIEYREGEAILEMDTAAGALGGPLRAVVHTREDLEVGEAVRVEVEMLRRHGTATEPYRTTTPLWRDEHLTVCEAPRRDGFSVSIPLAFLLPFDMDPSSVPPVKKRVWQVVVHRAREKSKFFAEFRIPVFKTDSSDERITVEALRLATEPACH